MKIRESVQFQTALVVYDQEIVRNPEVPSCSRMKTMEKRHIDQVMRSHFKFGNGRLETGVVTKSQKGRKVGVERKVGECYQWKTTGQCSKGDSCGFRHGEAPGKIMDKRDNGHLLHQKLGHRLTEKNQRKFLVSEKSLGKCSDASCDCCQNYKFVVGCKCDDYWQFRHTEVDEQPSKK